MPSTLPPPRRHIVGVWGSALLLLVTSLLLWRWEAHGGDARLAAWLLHVAPHAGTSAAWRTASMFGHGGITMFVLACCLLAARRPRTWVAAAVAVVAAGLVCSLLKEAIDRARPGGSGALSWPSGHTATAFAVAGTLLVARHRAWLPWLLVAILVMTARVVLGRHFPSDVSAGAAFGFVAGWSIGGRVFLLLPRRPRVPMLLRRHLALADALQHWRVLLASALLGAWWLRALFGAFVGDWLGVFGGPLLLFALLLAMCDATTLPRLVGRGGRAGDGAAGREVAR